VAAGCAAEVLLVSLSQLPPATPKNPPPFIASLLLLCKGAIYKEKEKLRNDDGTPLVVSSSVMTQAADDLREGSRE